MEAYVNIVKMDWENLEMVQGCKAYWEGQLEKFANYQVIYDEVELHWIHNVIVKCVIAEEKINNEQPEWMGLFQ